MEKIIKNHENFQYNSPAFCRCRICQCFFLQIFLYISIAGQFFISVDCSEESYNFYNEPYLSVSNIADYEKDCAVRINPVYLKQTSYEVLYSGLVKINTPLILAFVFFNESKIHEVWQNDVNEICRLTINKIYLASEVLVLHFQIRLIQVSSSKLQNFRSFSF